MFKKLTSYGLTAFISILGCGSDNLNNIQTPNEGGIKSPQDSGLYDGSKKTSRKDGSSLDMNVNTRQDLGLDSSISLDMRLRDMGSISPDIGHDSNLLSDNYALPDDARTTIDSTSILPDAGVVTPDLGPDSFVEPPSTEVFEPREVDCDVPYIREHPDPMFRRVSPSGLEVRPGRIITPGEFIRPSACSFDADNDGDIDYLTMTQDRGVLFLNDGTMFFTPDENFPDIPLLNILGCLPFDYDGDGWVDVLVTSPTKLYKNVGGSGWTDVTVEQGFSYPNCFVMSSAACDVDGNETLDVIVGCHSRLTTEGLERIYLFINDGTSFAEEGMSRGMSAPGRPTLAVACLDIDNDGDQDILEGNDFGYSFNDRLWINDGTGNFTDRGSDFGLDEWLYMNELGDGIYASADTMGYALADYALNRTVGIAVSDFGSSTARRRVLNILLANYDRATDRYNYEEIGPEGGIDIDYLIGWDTKPFDADLDGDPDVIVVTEDEGENPLYLNIGSRRFIRYVSRSFIGDPILDLTRASGVVVADFDGDYDEDVIIADHEDIGTVARNVGTVGYGTKLDLRCPSPNTRCIGAKVVVDLPGGCSRLEQKIAGEGFGSGKEGPLHFGIGELTETTATIRFPDGYITETRLYAGETTVVSRE